VVHFAPILAPLITLTVMMTGATAAFADDVATTPTTTESATADPSSAFTATPAPSSSDSSTPTTSASATPSLSTRVTPVGTTDVFTFAADALCSTSGAVTFDAGAVSIDFAAAELDGFGAVDIPAESTSSCRDSLTSVTISNRSADPITELTIESYAFAQTSTSTDTPRISSITFPTNLTSLSIGDHAFEQYFQAGQAAGLTALAFPSGIVSLDLGSAAFNQTSDNTDTSLAGVNFPTSLRTLSIGSAAFFQSAWNGSTSLSSITFPDGLQNLSVGSAGFRQESTGGSVTLATASFPGSLINLRLGDLSFYQYADTTALKMFVFRATGTMGDGTGTIYIASEFENSAEWVWFGSDATEFGDAWNAATVDLGISPVFVGHRSITFDTADSATTTTSYVYRGGASYSAPTVFDASTLGSGWTISLPTATKKYYTLTGWCETQGCNSPLAVGTSYALSSLSQTVYAAWALNAPTIITEPQLPKATAGDKYDQLIETSGGGTITCSLTAGDLPPGVTLVGCTLTGTPTTAGDYSFTITATNEAGSTKRTFSMSVVAATSTALASTGAGDMVPLGALGVMLVSAGIAAVGLRRRFSHPHTRPHP
jgi:hypothetical protein